MDLMDKSSEIRATVFNEQCKQFFDMIEVGKVYSISKFSLKVSEKKFNRNDFEIVLTPDTQILPCNDQDDLKNLEIKFNFEPLSSIRTNRN